MKKKLFYYLLKQELFYVSVCFIISLLVSVNNGLDAAIKAFAYCLLFLQPVIIIINKNIIIELIGFDQRK